MKIMVMGKRDMVDMMKWNGMGATMIGHPGIIVHTIMIHHTMIIILVIGDMGEDIRVDVEEDVADVEEAGVEEAVEVVVLMEKLQRVGIVLVSMVKEKPRPLILRRLLLQKLVHPHWLRQNSLQNYHTVEEVEDSEEDVGAAEEEGMLQHN